MSKKRNKKVTNNVLFIYSKYVFLKLEFVTWSLSMKHGVDFHVSSVYMFYYWPHTTSKFYFNCYPIVQITGCDITNGPWGVE